MLSPILDEIAYYVGLIVGSIVKIAMVALTLGFATWVWGGRRRRRETSGERSRRIDRQRRGQVLRRWLDESANRGPVPDIGLHCPSCSYLLTGLAIARCPECGTEIDFDDLARNLER